MAIDLKELARQVLPYLSAYKVGDEMAPQFLKLDGTRPMTSDLNMGGSRVINSPSCSVKIYNNADIVIGNNAITYLTYNTIWWDYDKSRDTVNTGRLKSSHTGVYFVCANVRWAANANGTRRLFITFSGSRFVLTSASSMVNSGTITTDMTVSTLAYLAEGDYVECGVYQDSGGNLNVVFNNWWSPHFMMARIA